jgi:D-alanyl-D-alanine carboxypeptidase
VAKKKFQILIQAFLFLFIVTPASFSQECGRDYSSLVVNAKSGEILFENQADKIIYPASLVKLMTIYLTFEAIKENKLNLEDDLTTSERSISVSKVNKFNKLDLKSSDIISAEKAIRGSIVKSFNELTVMLAEKISGDEWQFVRNMNLKAKNLGMTNTNFRNASGLHDAGQFTTNEDLAKLALAIKKDFPEYYHHFSLKEFAYKNIKYKTHNHVLLEYKGADGIKTGFTKAAGFNLITSAKKNNMDVISIITGCESFQKRDALAKQLLDRVLQKKLSYKLKH